MNTPPVTGPKKPAAAPSADRNSGSSVPLSAGGIGPRPSSGQPESMVRALEQFIAATIGEQLTAMLDGADEILFEMANSAKGNDEQRLYLDTLRVIRHEKPRMLRTFQDNLKQSFADGRLQRSAANVDLDDMESWSLRSADDIEETVTVTNLESKAGSLYQKEIFELENRLETLAQRGGETVTSKLMMPGHIFAAMRDSLKSMDMDFPVKQVIYRLAERGLVNNMREVYVGANQMLAARGFEQQRTRATPASRTTSPSATPAAEAPGTRPAAPDSGAGSSVAGGGAVPQSFGGGGFAAPSAAADWPSGMSAQRLLAGLSQVAGNEAQGPVYSDTQLATEMASAIHSLSHGRPVDSWMPAPNLVLAGRMFDSLYQDRLLSETSKPLLSRLQFPVMKTALADPEFFSNAVHPVRQLVHDVFEMLASVSKPQADDIHQLSALVDNVLKEFEVAPERLGKAELRAPAVSEAIAEKFLAEHEKRVSSQSARSVEKVRRLVAMELHLRTAPRVVPDSIRPLLLSGFGPMLVHSMLNGGPEGIAWKGSMSLLDRMLDSLEPSPTLTPAQREPTEVTIKLEISQRLLDIGLPNGKVQRLLAGLVDAYKALLSVSAETPSPAAQALAAETRARTAARHALATILIAGSWFQVWDSSRSQRRWLKLHAHIPAQRVVVFEDFLGTQHLRVRDSNFIHDLIAGRSAPVDPNPTMRRALGLLPPLADELEVVIEAPVWTSSSQPVAAV